MTALEFIRANGVARSERIVKSKPCWASYYNIDIRDYSAEQNDSTVSIEDLIEVLVGCTG